MTLARIFRPDKSAMQSGRAKTGEWVLEFAPGSAYFIDGLTGWAGMRDTTRQVRLHFPTREAAQAYAQKHGVAFEVYEPRARRQVRKAYADNFLPTAR